ncbi:MAG TPA: acyl-CoA synthetase (NDP forming), partial [Archaeoglobus veneficus]|nr:acyl-CoA synthetase (NDP forming) [Archaeoglobus veneficus]
MEKMLNEYEAKKLLEKHNINVVPTYIANSESEALEVAKNLGYPIVMKILSDKITHKTEYKGVILDIRNDEELINAYRRLSKIEKSVTVQKMARGFEFSVGISYDKTFGKTIMFGIGGIFVELLKDFTLRILPIDRKDAENMINEIKASKIFYGYRGIKANKERVIELLLKVSELAKKEPIKQMDLNPVFVNEENYFVADARIVLDERIGKKDEERRKIGDISFLFNPKSVAVIGASRTKGKPGNTIIRNLINLGFEGKIFPINPKAKDILNLKCYSSILDVEEDVDVAIIAVPSKHAVEVVRQCVEKGVKGLIIISS